MNLTNAGTPEIRRSLSQLGVELQRDDAQALLNLRAKIARAEVRCGSSAGCVGGVRRRVLACRRRASLR